MIKRGHSGVGSVSTKSFAGSGKMKTGSLAIYSTFAHIMVFHLRYRRDLGFRTSLVITNKQVL